MFHILKRKQYRYRSCEYAKNPKNVIRATGVGLQSSERVSLTLRPAPASTGIVFRRIDLDPVVEIKASPELGRDPQLTTTLESGSSRVAIVEHLMSAFAKFSIDNAWVDLTTEEVPIMDGSDGPLVFLIQSAGIQEQGT